jgi:SAM-dependent methyltransferase
MTNRDTFYPHDCDLCGSSDAVEIEVARHYTKGEPIHVCRNCGFVFARMRRSAERIAEVWSEEIYGSTYEYGKTYTAHMPAMKARQTYVVDFADMKLGLKGKRLLDIGAGEGQFLDMARKPPYEAEVYGVEPSERNCGLMADMGINSFCGTAEAFRESAVAKTSCFDVATLMWTLVNCRSPRALLECAWDVLDEGGHVVLGEGSRILVPFRKPLQYYFGPGPQDTHAFHFSANALQGFLATSGFEVVHINRFIDTDYLAVIGRKVPRERKIPWQKDDWRAVLDFFERWHRETQSFYADA